MKPSKDKIEKLHLMFPVNVTEEEIPRYLAVFENKINEVIDKLESQPEEQTLCRGCGQCIHKDPSPKKEQCDTDTGTLCMKHGCYHIKVAPTPEPKHIVCECVDCKKALNCVDDKQVIYTSEGDAVGEVSK